MSSLPYACYNYVYNLHVEERNQDVLKCNQYKSIHKRILYNGIVVGGFYISFSNKAK